MRGAILSPPPNQRGRLLRVLILIGLLSACGTPRYNPWTVPKQLFRDRVSVIAVLPPRTEVPGLNVNTLTAPVESELRALGYTVVRTAQLAEILTQLRNPDTAGATATGGGRGTPATRQQAVDRLESFRIDAWVRPTVVVASADYHGWTAQWHGMTQTIEATDGSMVSDAWLTRGQVPALSLQITVENLAGTICYRGYGGIEMLKQRKGFVFVPAPLDTRLLDSARNRNAARIALSQLGRRSTHATDVPRIAVR